MERKDIEPAIITSFLKLQKSLPIKTGNMAFNATQLKDGSMEYTIEIKDKIAPYAKYLNNPKWRSYRFWEKSVEDVFLDSMVKLTGGKLTKD